MLLCSDALFVVLAVLEQWSRDRVPHDYAYRQSRLRCGMRAAELDSSAAE